MRLFLTVLTVLLYCFSISAQREVLATRIEGGIKVDGHLDEQEWVEAPNHGEFLTIDNTFGDPSLTDIRVKMLYDNENVYFSAYMPSESKDAIATELAERDGIGNSDWFLVMLDTYGSGTNAVEFLVTSAGVQFDAKVGSNGEDSSWDEVWRSAVSIEDNGWYAEMAIPYSALRFPELDVQKWKANFIHRCIATGQKCTYQEIDPDISGFVNQSAKVSGVEGIKAPKRLSLTPYATVYSENYKPAGDEAKISSFTYSGGMDLKFGLNEAFTVDMTLIPDFGQVRADDRILNLSPFEVRFSENRAFFTEGIELFSRADLFYSRRVGGTPIGRYEVEDQLEEGEVIDENPSQSQLYNATKVSGRFGNGLGVGVFNALSSRTHATVKSGEGSERKVLTAPLTNYNVTVFDQILPNNSYISLINTNVSRFNDEYRNANVTGTEFLLRFMDQTLSVSGNTSVSQLINKQEDNDYGVSYSLDVDKNIGSFSIGAGIEGISRDYNINDIGFSTFTGTKDYSINSNYRFTDGISIFTFMNTWLGTYLTTTYDDQFSSIHMNGGIWGRTKGQWIVNMWTNFGPKSYDYFEARTSGYRLEVPAYYNMGWWVSTDRRKMFSLGVSIFGNKKINDPGYYRSFSLEPSIRFNDRFSVNLSTSVDGFRYGRGYVTKVDDKPIIGMRRRSTVSNILGFKYSFSKDITLRGRIRHYFTKVNYDSYHDLSPDGQLSLNDSYEGVDPFMYNDLNLNVNLRYRFAPGSDIILQWQNNISGSQTLDEDVDRLSYRNGLKHLGDLGQGNNLSLRVLYYINGGKYIS